MSETTAIQIEIGNEDLINSNLEKKANTSAKSLDFDPFLCDECREYGCCIKIGGKLPSSDADIKNWINIQTEIIGASPKFSKKLQQAHDLFHQDEYEQASYLYLDILQTRNECTEAWAGLSAAYYFLGKYEDAISSANHLQMGFARWFSKRCEIMIKGGE